ncbi:MAG TPA: hypothetical protein VGK88_11465 [bacterium]|jgi:hypothetical protein
MSTLVLKVLLTPALVAVASLAGRRWGPGVSGWFVGFPFTSGPVALFLALDHGTDFAAVAAVGTLGGTISQVAFCLGYALVAHQYGWLSALGAGTIGFAAVTSVLQVLPLAAVPLLLVVSGSVLAALHLLPDHGVETRAQPLPRWDLPARMILATLVVVLLTGFAQALGPRLTGSLAPYPVYAGVLAIFAHRQQGPGAAGQVLRGLLFGLFGFAGFFTALAVLLSRIGIPAAFLAAIAVALTIQAVTLRVLRGPGGPAAGNPPT